MREHFSADYPEARAKFRAAATASGARLTAYPHPAKGPGGEALTLDAARLGPAAASRLLMTISGTHGAEGFAGSAAQVASFAAGIAAALPPDTAFLAVHAANPFGFAWLRRVTEDNVDLNRNFVDFARPLPANPDYDALAAAICPARWDAAARAAADARLEAYRQAHGAAALQRAISGGQYTHPHGLFYGGTEPSWSRRTLLQVIEAQGPRLRRLAFIDYHTGLGPYGHGELMSSHGVGGPALARARAWYGDALTVPGIGGSASPDIEGDNIVGLARLLPGLEVTGVVLEFGVRPLQDTFDALRADAWLHRYGRLASAEGRAIKAMMRHTFCGDDDDWKTRVVEQALATERQALAGLAG
jgi:hypothetical protein